jgi:hypothetical protein
MITKLFLYFTYCRKLFPRFLKIICILFLFVFSSSISSGINNSDNHKYTFVWIDNSLKSEKLNKVYLISSNNKNKKIVDTIQALKFNPVQNDTIYFLTKKKLNSHVFIEFSYETYKKGSNRFLLLPQTTYNLTEFNDKLVIKPRLFTFDMLDLHTKILYTFLIQLVTELLLAFPIALILKLPMRLYFFVFVANIMSFPVQYIGFLPIEIKEILSMLLEGIFISLIGWKRLKFTKAMLVSFVLNSLRFGIAKIIVLIFKIL